MRFPTAKLVRNLVRNSGSEPVASGSPWQSWQSVRLVVTCGHATRNGDFGRQAPIRGCGGIGRRARFRS